MSEDQYCIVRFRQGAGGQGQVIEVGLTRDEVEAHCSDPSTRGEGWFDGFDLESNRPEGVAEYNELEGER